MLPASTPPLPNLIPPTPMHTDSMPPEPEAAVTPARKDPNTLTLKERIALMEWCEQHRDRCATDTDPELAAAASIGCAFIVTVGNISGMRRQLDITKRKPAAPAHDIDLVALQARVAQHHLQLDPVAGINLAEALSNLRNTLHALEARLDTLESANN